MDSHYKLEPFYVETYGGGVGGGGGYQCDGPGYNHYEPEVCYQQMVYREDSRHARFPKPHEFHQGGYGHVSIRGVDFEESSLGGSSRKINVDEAVDNEVDDYIKGIHNKFERRMWTTFRK